MKGQKVHPFVERDDYALSSWISDLLNIIKKRGFLMKKEDAFIVYQDNASEFMEYYTDGMSPMESFLEFEEYNKE